MSDELIEGHALRGQQPEPETESSKPLRSSTHVPKAAPPQDEPTGPYIILEPPPEAGDVLSRQSEMSTFHKGLQPIVIDETASAPDKTPDQPASQPAPSDDLSLSADLPWSVIESTSPDLFTRKKNKAESGAAGTAEPPPDFLPHFHTPTGAFPPVREELPPAEESKEPAPPAEQPPDFLPHFHTPTGIFPPVEEELPPAEESKEPAPPAEPPPDFLPHFHTPTGIFPPITEDLLTTSEAEESAPDFSLAYRTPAGILPPIRDDLYGPPEPKETAPAAPELETPSAEPPDVLPGYRTPVGVFPPIRENRWPDSKRDKSVPGHEGMSESLPVEPLPDLAEPVPVTHFQEGLHPPQDTEDTTPPPAVPISEESSEFIPLFHTPTSILPPVPGEAPVIPPASIDISEGQSGDEVVDAEIVFDVDRRLQRARRKLKATADKATSSEQKRKSRLLTGMAVVVITVLAVLVPSAFRYLAGDANQSSDTPGDSTQAPGGVAAPGSGQTPGVPLLLTPTATIPPLYSQGWLVYSSNRDGDYEIYTVDMRNQQLTRMTDNPAADRSPKWSPDGRQLAFVSDRSGNDDIYIMSANGGEPIRLTGNAGSDRNPSWAPDGSRIVFSRETVDGSHLMSMSTSCLSAPETCEDQTHALTPGGYDLYPDWSPDGRWVAFAASDFPGLPSSVALISPEGDGYNALSGTGTSDFYPAWSPDGNRIAFVSYAQGDYDLWVMGANGQGIFQLTQNEAADVEPAWSPDGAFIIFASDRSAEGDFELFLIRSDCTSPQIECEASIVPLTNDSADDLNPDWIR